MMKSRLWQDVSHEKIGTRETEREIRSMLNRAFQRVFVATCVRDDPELARSEYGLLVHYAEYEQVDSLAGHAAELVETIDREGWMDYV